MGFFGDLWDGITGGGGPSDAEKRKVAEARRRLNEKLGDERRRASAAMKQQRRAQSEIRREQAREKRTAGAGDQIRRRQATGGTGGLLQFSDSGASGLSEFLGGNS